MQRLSRLAQPEPESLQGVPWDLLGPVLSIKRLWTALASDLFNRAGLHIQLCRTKCPH